MAIARKNATGAVQSSASIKTVNLPAINTAVGDWILVGVAGASAISSISDTAGNSYISLGISYYDSQGDWIVDLWACKGAVYANTSNVINVVMGVNARFVVGTSSYTGVSALGLTAKTQDGGGAQTVASDSLNTQDNNNWVVGAFEIDGAKTPTATTGTLCYGNSTTGVGFGLVDNGPITPAGTGAVAISWTGATYWGATMVELRVFVLASTTGSGGGAATASVVASSVALGSGLGQATDSEGSTHQEAQGSGHGQGSGSIVASSLAPGSGTGQGAGSIIASSVGLGTGIGAATAGHVASSITAGSGLGAAAASTTNPHQEAQGFGVGQAAGSIVASSLALGAGTGKADVSVDIMHQEVKGSGVGSGVGSVVASSMVGGSGAGRADGSTVASSVALGSGLGQATDSEEITHQAAQGSGAGHAGESIVASSVATGSGMGTAQAVASLFTIGIRFLGARVLKGSAQGGVEKSKAAGGAAKGAAEGQAVKGKSAGKTVKDEAEGQAVKD